MYIYLLMFSELKSEKSEKPEQLQKDECTLKLKISKSEKLIILHFEKAYMPPRAVF